MKVLCKAVYKYSFYKTVAVFRNFFGKLQTVNHNTWQDETSAVGDVKPVCGENAKKASFYFLPHSKRLKASSSSM